MARVFLAHDAALNRDVVSKVLGGDPGNSVDFTRAK